MKLIFFKLIFVAAIIGFSSCGKSNVNADQQHVESVPADEQAVAQRVNDIYADVFSQEGKDYDSLYCSHDWNDKVKQITEFDNQHHSGEMGFFEADYWVMGQDADKLGITDVTVTELQGDRAVVGLNLHNCGSVSKVRLEMVREDGEWKIDNFINAGDEEYDWKASMVGYLEEQK